MADQLLYGTENNPAPNRRAILEAYGRHADAEEALGDPVKIRRFIVKAITPLFAGEPHGKRYRIALDEIAGLPKKLHAQGKALEGQPKLSELVMNAATMHLSDEVLDRSPEETYERILWEESKQNNFIVHGSSEPSRRAEVQEWQETRKAQGGCVYEQVLASGDGNVA